ncbi:MAG: DEAD/DEAH box helicase [Thermoanaerobaculia bacterium]
MAAAAPTVESVVESLRADSDIGSEIAGAFFLEPRIERRTSWEPALPGSLAAALTLAGVDAPWSHQAGARAALRHGENVLVTTPTASGKSLVFQLPVLEAAAAGEDGCALFVYPLKALGRDQQERFRALAEAAGLAEAAPCEVYDGDTPASLRRRIRADPPRALITNPDMLHLSMLGYAESWELLFSRLRWIVLDELHAYRGLFGAHVHHVLRRVLRLARLKGRQPQLIASSATAAEADDFAAALTGEQFTWIEESGAASQGRHLLLLQPQASPYTTTLKLLVRLLDEGLKVIAFTKARRITELLYAWLGRQRPDLARRVASYRSGFLPEERRKIEGDLFAGRLSGVISTSALEMGIDVGGLDACILVGYPGSIMATWQRSGRAGRRGRPGLTALVALPDALDQYLLDHPQMLLESPCERLAVDPDNETVARAHLICAAAEAPLHRERDRALLERHAPLIGELLQEHELKEAADTGELLAARRRPHRQVDLRHTRDTVVIRDADGTTIGTVDGVRARLECHPGAIYLHAGRQYQVRELDLDAGEARVQETDADYYTTALTEKETEILEVLEERRGEAPAASFGLLRVTERVVGFERRRIYSRELLGQEPLELPPHEFETQGLWIPAPRAVTANLEADDHHVMGSLHAAEHAAIALLPLLAVCDRGDLGGISIPMHPQLEQAVVFVYDAMAGGAGITRRGFRELPQWLERVRELVARCDCEEGCPRCIQSPKCGNGNRPLDKAGAVRLLELLATPQETEAAGLRAGRVVRPAGRALARGHEEPRRRGPARSDGPPASDPGSRRPAETPAASVARDHPASTVLFDLETQLSAEEVGGWGNAHRMRVAIGVALYLEEGRFETFEEERVPELVEQLESAGLVVGFNVKRFDYRVLAGYTGIDYARQLPTLDLLEDIYRRLGFRLGLNHLAQATLGVEKSADGLQSLEWVRQGRLDLVAAYCRRDVEILRDLYLHGRRTGQIVYLDRDGRPINLPVHW